MARPAIKFVKRIKRKIAKVYLGIGKGVTSNTFGHAFIYVEFLKIKTGGLYYDANPSPAGFRRIVAAGGANLRGLFRAGAVPGIVLPQPMSRAEAMKRGRLIPIAKLGIIGYVGWSGWIRGVGGDISYKFFAIPGGKSVSCYTWAGESALKAIAMSLL